MIEPLPTSLWISARLEYEVFFAVCGGVVLDQENQIVGIALSKFSKEDLDVPENVLFIALPPYSPELDPVERWFQEFRRALANRCFDTIAALHDALSRVLELFTQAKERLELLTDFP